jgi:transposase-like protein
MAIVQFFRCTNCETNFHKKNRYSEKRHEKKCLKPGTKHKRVDLVPKKIIMQAKENTK